MGLFFVIVFSVLKLSPIFELHAILLNPSYDKIFASTFYCFFTNPFI